MVNEYINNEVDKIYNTIVINEEIQISKFNKLDKIIKIILLEKYLKNIYKEEIIKLNNKHINIIIEEIIKNKNKSINLPLKKVGIIEYNKFKIK